MNFSKTTSYALSILSHMARVPGERYSSRKLSEELGIPKEYLRHILTSLSGDGFIRSIQGRSGGFCLNREASEISLASIVDAVEGLHVMKTCIMGFKDCPFDQKCAMHSTWEETRNNIVRILETTTLDMLLPAWVERDAATETGDE